MVKITVSVSAEEAEKLYWAANSGELAHLGITSAEYLIEEEASEEENPTNSIPVDGVGIPSQSEPNVAVEESTSEGEQSRPFDGWDGVVSKDSMVDALINSADVSATDDRPTHGYKCRYCGRHHVSDDTELWCMLAQAKK